MTEDQFSTILKKGFRLAAVLIAFVRPPTVLAEEPRIVDLEFHSEVLGKEMPFTLVRPADEAAANGAVLFLLHGRGRHNHSLIESDEAR